LIENLQGTENHHFNEFEMTILIVLKISRNSLLHDRGDWSKMGHRVKRDSGGKNSRC
jgi:hypothetical protein